MSDREKELSPEEEAAREQFVVDQFERVGLDIREYPELFERFKLLNGPESKHFEDAAQMVDIIEALWPELETEFSSKLDKKKLLQATLLHDVGKSGPEKATPDEQELVVSLFNPRHYPAVTPEGESIRDALILHAIRASDFDDNTRRKIARYLNKLGVNIATENMLGLWQRHAKWTYDILKASKDDKIDERLAAMAASHHVLDGVNPAEKDPSGEAKTIEIVESYEVLTMVDKFQAYMRRGDKSHPEAIKELRARVDKAEISEDAKKDYFKIIAVIESSADKFQSKPKT